MSGALVLTASLTLMPGVPLNVHLVRGAEGAALIDSGISAMRESVLGLCREGGPVRWLLVTHAHADHIGNNAAVKEATGATVAAAGAFAWIEDLDRHYREFCRPERVPEAPGQREEILGLMDGPVQVEHQLQPGEVIDLGGAALDVVPFPGHKLEEVGFLERESGDLFTGDLLLALAAPFFHGFETASGFRSSLDRLEWLLREGAARRVLAAHHPPLSPEAASAQVAVTRAFLDDVEQATLEAAEGVPFDDLWRGVSARLGKEADFRGHAMLEAQVAELAAAGRLSLHDGLVERR